MKLKSTVNQLSNRLLLKSITSMSTPPAYLNRPFQIAIDGPAASGKSTTAKLVASQLNFEYLNTGNLYRAVTYKALMNNILGNVETSSDAIKVIELANSLDIKLKGDQVLVDGSNITDKIRGSHVTSAVALVAKIPEVRERLLQIQRQIAYRELAGNVREPNLVQGVVMEGRDIGSVVLPQAELKVFLDADVRSRAMRRFIELGASELINIEKIESDIKARDDSDYARPISPLTKCPDAHIIDTSNLTIEQQTSKIVALARKLMEENL